MRPNQVKLIAKQLGVNRAGRHRHASLNASIREVAIPVSCKTSWSTKAPSQETVLVEGDELDSRRRALASALSVLNNRERRIFEARRLTEEPITLKELADEFGVSRERVRQIDVSSFVKVQRQSRAAAT